MLFRVCQMSYAIHKLKIFGHMAFLKWSISLPCSTYLYDLCRLDNKIDEYETILINWIHYIWKCRYHYPELNFYSTNQLILLRKELTSIQQNKCDQINPQVFHLLHSIARRPVESTMLIKKVLKGAVLDDEDEAMPKPVPLVLNSNQTIASSFEQKSSDQEASKVFYTIQNLTNEEKKLFNELKNYGYDDFIILEAINQNISDIYTATDWIDSLNNDTITKFESQWIVKKASPITTVKSIEQSTMECCLPINTQKLSEELDITPIAISFFSKNVTR